jgi:hypothetical protein
MSMNAPISRSSAALLALGAVMILLLGAFTHLDPAAPPPALATDSPADAAIEAAGEPALPANLSPGLAEIFKLAQARVDENVILAFIHNSNETYSPTADEILYLSDLGLSQTVIAALFKQKPPAPSENLASDAIPARTPLASAKFPSLSALHAGPETNAGLFYNALAPYGTWAQVPAYGLVWQPTTETLNPDWRPYVDQGQWLNTDDGWYWQSGYSWGWAAFHYGRWSKDSRLGWVWIPDKVWGPAWVSWRVALSYSGWAPLPPGVGLATAGGLTFNNRRVAAGFDFGLPATWFTFVSEDNFLNRNLPGYTASASQAAAIFTRSLAINNYSIPNHRLLNLGPDESGTIASAETETEPVQIKRAPSRSRDLVAEPQIDAEPLIAAVSREEVVRDLPPLSPILPALPSLQSPKNRRHRWLENNPAHSNFAGAPRWEPPFNRENLKRFPGAQALACAFQSDPARMMAASFPAASKPGR